MLEAVNSVLQTAPLARGNAEQTSNARSLAANPDKIQEAPRAPYISPFIFVDVNFDKAVLQIRDSDTGDVITQFPSESRLRFNSAQQASTQRAEVNTAPAADLPDAPSRSASTQAPQQSDTPAPQQSTAPPSGDAATAQQLAAFKTAAVSSSAGNGGNVSLFA